MTYNAELTFKFDATYTHTYSGFGSTIGVDDFVPEEHYVITAPAADLNAKQYFKLFEKFMLCVGMDQHNIRSGAMSLVFNDYTSEADQREICKEYELTMDEDLRSKFEDWKKTEAEWENIRKGPMGTVLEDDWKEKFDALHRRFKRFAALSDHQLEDLANYAAKTYYVPDDCALDDKEKCQEYNMREQEYYDKRAKLDLQQQTDLRN